jgi:predicted metal-dependent hydrolase
VSLELLNKVKIEHGKIKVSSTSLNNLHLKNLVDDWYKNKAIEIFNSRLEECIKIGAKAGINYKNKITLRSMKTRWGSCSSEPKITLNPKLISLSKDFIDYVIIHELCHIKEHNHSQAFYKLLKFLLPDWEQRKEKLNLVAESRLL